MYVEVNGHSYPYGKARLAVEDRGTQFADAVYEVITIHQNQPLELEFHVQRLQHNLAELRISFPLTMPALRIRIKDYLLRYQTANAMLYLQISRGTLVRQHAWGEHQLSPNWVMYARPWAMPAAVSSLAVISVPDTRWQRVDIKTVNLLPNCLAKQQAIEQGADDAWLFNRDGNYLEATSANIWVVIGHKIYTPAANNAILPGTVRRAIIEVLPELQLQLQEQAITPAMLQQADAVLQTSSSQLVSVISKFDGRSVGSNKAINLATILRDTLLRRNK